VVSSEDDRWSVVLVDDSKEIRTLVRRRLELSGSFEVVGEGADGDEAIGLVDRHHPALILLDASMPTADGIEALPTILAVRPETKVVMYTGFEDRGLAARALELGAVDFVEKSVPLDELVQRLLRVLARTTAPSTLARAGLRVVGEADDVQQSAGEEAVLDEHTARFRELFDQAVLGMATLTTTGTIVRPNRALAELLGCGIEELVGIDYGRLTCGRGDEFDRGLEALCTFGQDVATFEHSLPGPPGEDSPRTVCATLTPIRDAQRRVLYVFAQVRDVTAQYAAQDSVRRTEEMFRLLVASVGQYAIFMLDVAGNVVSWNPGAQRIKGYRANEIIGRHFRVFYPPEEQDSGHPERNLEAALRDGTFTEEGWRMRNDGSRFRASVAINAVFDDAGDHVGFAKVTRDHTEHGTHL
jgi:PAS domain S-box-containing protein